MRASLLILGAFLLVSYPLVLLLSIANGLEKPRREPAAASITLTPRSGIDRASEVDAWGRPLRGALRPAAIGKGD